MAISVLLIPHVMLTYCRDSIIGTLDVRRQVAGSGESRVPVHCYKLLVTGFCGTHLLHVYSDWKDGSFWEQYVIAAIRYICEARVSYLIGVKDEISAGSCSR